MKLEYFMGVLECSSVNTLSTKSLYYVSHTKKGIMEDPRNPWGMASNFAVIFLNFQRLKNLHITNEETKYIFVSCIKD